jgi:Lipase (class 3)
MARLRVCGRKINQSSDNFNRLSLYSILFHLSRIGVFIYLVHSLFSQSIIQCDTYVQGFFIAVLVFSGISIIHDSIFNVLTRQGTLSEESKRQNVPYFFLSHIALALITLALCIFGLVLTYNMPSRCISITSNWSTNTAVMSTSIIGIIVVGYRVLGWRSLLTGTPILCERSGTDFDATFTTDKVRYTRCCRRFKFGIRFPPSIGSVDDIFQNVGTSLAAAFEPLAVFDMTPSDILAAFVLLRLDHQEEEMGLLENISNEKGDVLRSLDKPIQQTFGESSGKAPEVEVLSSDEITLIRHIDNSIVSMESKEYFSQKRLDRFHLRQKPLRPHHLVGSSPIDVTKQEELSLLEDATYFSTYICGVYGWPLWSLMNSSHFLCSLPVLATAYMCGDVVGYCFKEKEDVDNPYRRSHYRMQHKRDTMCGCDVMDPFGCNEIAYRHVVKHGIRHDIEYRSIKNSIETLAIGLVPIEKPVKSSSKDDLFFFSKRNEYFHPPFAVSIDHNRKCIVVSVRGSLSVADLITDLHAVPLDITHMFFPTSERPRALLHNLPGQERVQKSGGFVHGGIFKAAQALHKYLIESDLLECALRGPSDASARTGSCKAVFPSGHTGFDLVICGHSLGAGTATYLSLLLQPDFPHLKCFAYSPPGACASKELAEGMNPFLTSIVLGKDIITRLSLPSSINLFVEMVEATARCKITKAQLANIQQFEMLYGSFCSPTGPLGCFGMNSMSFLSSESLAVSIAKQELQKLRSHRGCNRFNAEYAMTPRGTYYCEKNSEYMKKLEGLLKIQKLERVDRNISKSENGFHSSLGKAVYESEYYSSSREGGKFTDIRKQLGLQKYICGKIIHLVKVGTLPIDPVSIWIRGIFPSSWVNFAECLSAFLCFPCRRVRKVYQARWSERESFTRILVSTDAAEDHFPDKLMYALRESYQDALFDLNLRKKATQRTPILLANASSV